MSRNFREIYCGHFPWKLKDEKSAKNFAKISPHFSPISSKNFARTSLWGVAGTRKGVALHGGVAATVAGVALLRLLTVQLRVRCRSDCKRWQCTGKRLSRAIWSSFNLKEARVVLPLTEPPEAPGAEIPEKWEKITKFPSPVQPPKMRKNYRKITKNDTPKIHFL